MVAIIMHPIISEDGTIGCASWRDHEYAIKSHTTGVLEGLTDKSREVIDKYGLNSNELVKFRKNNLLLIELSKSLKDEQDSYVYVLVNSLISILDLNRNAGKHLLHCENHLRMMLYANGVTALETFLSDLFMSYVKIYDFVLHRLANSYEPFKKEKYSLKELIEDGRSSSQIAFEKLQGVLFHNLGASKSLYETALQIVFPDCPQLHVAIKKRHDIVHRNGCMQGETQPDKYSNSDVVGLVISVQGFAVDLIKSLISSSVKENS